MAEIITKGNMIELTSISFQLNNLTRWSDFRQIDGYDELGKQAFNCIVAYLLAKYIENKGKKIRWSLFPKIAIGRAFAKVYVYYDTPEHKISEMAKLGGIGKNVFDETARAIIKEKTNEDMARFLCDTVDEDSVEVKIYKAATKIATYIEFQEHPEQPFDEKEQNIRQAISEYTKVIPEVAKFSDEKSELFPLFKEISSLRNKVRWATCPKSVKCSVLGHLFDTAIWAYFIALEQSHFDEEYATRCFWMGIFHDVAETWTHDVPSPIKDKVVGFRKATERYEQKILDEYVYKRLEPLGLSDAVKSVMFEEEENASFKDLLKSADYLSADSECWRNLVAGSRYPYYWNAIVNRQLKNKTSKLNVMMHDFFVEYATKVLGK